MGDSGKPFEEMTRDELIAAARFWQSEYERVVHEHQIVLTLDGKELARAMLPQLSGAIRNATDVKGF